METKSETQKCCSGTMPKHKKVFLISMGGLLLAVFAVAIVGVGIKMHEYKNNITGSEFGRGQMMKDGRGGFAISAPVRTGDQFVLPQDAIKSGELAITVGNIETAKKAVTDIATKNGGNIYATFISYASSNMKNGSIVVQIPDVNFDKTFLDLKKVGSNVIQEKTLQIPQSNYYAVPMMGNVQENNVPVVDGAVKSATTVATPEIAMYPNPGYSQTIQNKGYIKVVFADYGVGVKGDNMMTKRELNSGSVIGIGSLDNRDMRNNPIVTFGIKLIFLIALIGLLLVVFKRLLGHVRRRKENAHKVHVVRQMVKVNKRVVKIAAKKKRKI